MLVAIRILKFIQEKKEVVDKIAFTVGAGKDSWD